MSQFDPILYHSGTDLTSNLLIFYLIEKSFVVEKSFIDILQKEENKLFLENLYHQNIMSLHNLHVFT